MKFMKTLALLLIPAVMLCGCGKKNEYSSDNNDTSIAKPGDDAKLDVDSLFTKYEGTPDPKTGLCTFEDKRYKISYPEGFSLEYAENENLVEIEITYEGENFDSADYSHLVINKMELYEGETLGERLDKLYQVYTTDESVSGAKRQNVKLNGDDAVILSYICDGLAYSNCYVAKNGKYYGAFIRCKQDAVEMKTFETILKSWVIK